MTPYPRLLALRDRLQLLNRIVGLIPTIKHLATRMIGTTKFLRPSSLIDFRHSTVILVDDVREFVRLLLPDVSDEEFRVALIEAERNLMSHDSGTQLEFPTNWNSGQRLRTVLFCLARLQLPNYVVETGTANGASADAWATAMRMNNHGVLASVDIVESSAPLLRSINKPYVRLLRTNGSMKHLDEVLHNNLEISADAPSIFLHDSDHSYFGQYNEYEMAERLNFKILLSDDVDSSMAFVDFSAKFPVAVAMIDGNKMIGGLRLRP